MNMPNLASCHHCMRRCWSAVGAPPAGSRPGGGCEMAGVAASTGAAAAAAINPRRLTEKSIVTPSRLLPHFGESLSHIHSRQIEVQHRLLLLEIRLVQF